MARNSIVDAPSRRPLLFVVMWNCFRPPFLAYYPWTASLCSSAPLFCIAMASLYSIVLSPFRRAPIKRRRPGLCPGEIKESGCSTFSGTVSPVRIRLAGSTAAVFFSFISSKFACFVYVLRAHQEACQVAVIVIKNKPTENVRYDQQRNIRFPRRGITFLPTR